MDDKNPRVGGERMSGRIDETTRGKVETAEPPTTTGAAGARSRTPSATPRAARTSGVSTPHDETSEGIEPRTHQIRAEIEGTREDLTETVNAIQDRLRPSNVAANAKETVKNAARERARDVAESEPVQYVRANPIPTAMIGVGLAGLAMLAFGDRDRQSSSRRRAYGKRDWRLGERDESSAARYTAYESADKYSPGLAATHYGGEDEPYLGSDARDLDRARGSRDFEYDRDRGRRDFEYDRSSARAWTGRGRQMLSQRQNQLRRTWDESPLLIGAASAVLGAIVGLAIPETERENELMGEARDSMVDQVQGTVREKVQEVQEAATKAANTVKDVATSVTGMSAESDTTASSANTRDTSMSGTTGMTGKTDQTR